MLAQAQKRLRLLVCSVELVQSDARAFVAEARFDAAICLCEGAFGLVGTGEDPDAHDPAILQRIFAALKPGAPFILTALNGAARHP